jgi:glutamyl-tRNA(Gln) amidotransferase subunit E
MVWSDDPDKTIAAGSWKRIRERLGAGTNDAVVVTWGRRVDADSGANEIEIRAREATEGVPSETRQALDDGTTGFERILPGPERMYPDTDLPPIALSRERVERIRQGVGEPVWEREDRLRKLGLSEDVVARLTTSPRIGLFGRLVNELDVDPKLAGEVVARRLTALAKSGYDVSVLGDDVITEVFSVWRDGRLGREGIVPVLKSIAETGAKAGVGARERVAGAIDRLGFNPLNRDELVAAVAGEVKAFDLSTIKKPEATHRHIMGILMEKLTGRAEGARVARYLESELKSASGV